MSNKEELKGRELIAAKSLAFYAGEYSEDADIPHLYCFMAKAMVAHGRLITRTDTLHAKWEAEARVTELETVVDKQQSALCASQENLSEAYRRNAGLQKGHATLTRRVQELEAKLKEAQQQLLENASGPFAIAGGKTFISSAVIEKGMITTFADSKLQADIEALTKRVSALELPKTDAKAIGEAVHTFVEHYLDQQTRIGGKLRGR